MSTIKSSAENLTLNADGSGNDVLVQSNGSTKAIVTAEGNVGIGTTSINFPSGSGLEVYDATIPRIKLANNTTGNASTDGLDIHIDGSTKDAKLFHREDANMIFATNASERMRIAADGNVGIGTTPESGQGSNSQGLYVGTHASLTSNGAYESVNLSENAYLATAASDAWKYRDTSHAARHEMKAGVHTLKVAASGSADAAITWNTGFEVLNDGKARAKNGLLFGTDTAAANALDDYEEGTWTPAITAGAIAYTSRIGRYTKIGNKVFIDAFIQISSITAASSYSIVTGLPFSSASSHYPSLASKTSGFNWAGSATMITFQVVPNGTTISAAGSYNNGTFNDINANGLLANDWIQFSGSYTVA